MELAAHWHRCQNLPKKRVNTLLLYRERDDPVKDGLANPIRDARDRYLPFSPSNLQNLSERSQMRSVFSKEGVYQCSYWRANAYIGGPDLLTWKGIYHIRNEPAVDPETGHPFSSRILVACLREGA